MAAFQSAGRRWSSNQRAARPATCSSAPGSSNRWEAPGTISIFTSARIAAAAARFIAITGTSSPPTIKSVGAVTRGSAGPARSGRPPRDTTAKTSPWAAAATSAAPPPVLAPKYPTGSPAVDRSSCSQRVTAPAPAAPKLSPTPDDEFINLGDWLRDDDVKKDTRMIVEEKEPTGDEEADFQDMLQKFKQGIAENVEEEDHQSHYDLGVAYKEMGLLDEAIAEFQKALRGPTNRVPTYEALGQCFMEKEQVPMAATILSRAIHEKGVSDDQLVGVLYLLGRCAEIRGQRDLALEYYHRVFVVDIQFKDVGERLASIESARS